MVAQRTGAGAEAVIAPPSTTSGRLAGTVAVGIVIVDGPTRETQFTAAERVEVVAEVQNGLTWLGTQTNGAPVTWSYEIRNVAVPSRPFPSSRSSRSTAGWSSTSPPPRPATGPG